MSRLSFASLAFVLFLASNVGVSDSDTGFSAVLRELMTVNEKLGKLDSRITVK